jgi:hypothetical protein
MMVFSFAVLCCTTLDKYCCTTLNGVRFVRRILWQQEAVLLRAVLLQEAVLLRALVLLQQEAVLLRASLMLQQEAVLLRALVLLQAIGSVSLSLGATFCGARTLADWMPIAHVPCMP